MEICRFLEWDSSFFGHRLAMVNGHRLDETQYTAIADWCKIQRIDGLYYLANADDIHSIQVAQAKDFNLRGIRVTLDHKANTLPVKPPANLTIRPARPADVPALEAIARGAYIQSRFYSDPHFKRDQCDTLYETWIRRSCLEDYADTVFVVESETRAVGYATCDIDSRSHEGKIPLVGLAESVRGQGIGRYLINYALQWFAQQQSNKVRVVTDGANIAAQRLYQKCGFRTQQVQLWYHLWFI